MRKLFLLSLMCLVSAFFGCAVGAVADGRFVSEQHRFSVVLPGPPFERVATMDADVVLMDPGTGASIAIETSPDTFEGEDQQEQALDYITRGLFFFLTKKQYRVFEEATIDGQPARHVVLSGLSDDNELMFSAYVARFSGAIYDIVLWARPEAFDRAAGVLDAMVGTFRFIREGAQ